MASKSQVLYIGVTSNLIKRVYEHKSDAVDGFSKKYQVHSLVFYEIFEDIRYAIEREKQLKAWKREWKLRLINEKNPAWEDLYQKIQE